MKTQTKCLTRQSTQLTERVGNLTDYTGTKKTKQIIYTVGLIVQITGEPKVKCLTNFQDSETDNPQN